MSETVRKKFDSFARWQSSIPTFDEWVSKYKQVPNDTAKGHLRSLQDLWFDPRVEGRGFKARNFMYGVVRALQIGSFDELKDGLSHYYQPTAYTHTYYFQHWIFEPALRALPQAINADLRGLNSAGVLPLRSLNAAIFDAPNGEPIIAVDSGLLHLVSYYNEVRTIANKMSNAEAEVYSIGCYENIVDYYLRSENSEIPYPNVAYELTEEDRRKIDVHNVCFETFVLCHELAHVALGHFDDLRSQDLDAQAADKATVNVWHHKWDDELAADFFGFNIYIAIINENPIISLVTDPGYAISKGIELFWLMHMIESADTKRQDITSHPPAKARLRNLVSNFIASLVSRGVSPSEVRSDPIVQKMVMATKYIDYFEYSTFSKKDRQ